jgi:hypothetical protein
MVRALYVILSLFALMSCAQIGTLSGGSKDVDAPVVVNANVPNFSTNVTPTYIQLRFNEFVELKNPTETVRLIPNDAVVKATLKKKTVQVVLEGTLKPNTTYSLFFDGAIKDVTEGNDSLYRWVFSTGKDLDSGAQDFRIRDAYKGNAMSGVYVGLFDELTDQKPRYLGLSDSKGTLRLSYVAPGNYYMKAFVDVNKNGQVDAFEPQDGHFTSQTLGKDTLDFRISKPLDKVHVKHLKFIPPGMLRGHLPYGFDLNQIQLNGEKIDSYRPTADSICIFLKDPLATEVVLTTKVDTFSFNRTAKDQKAALIPKGTSLGKNNQWQFEVNDKISSIQNETAWEIRSVQDSLPIQIDSIRYNQNHVFLFFKAVKGEKLKLTLPNNAIQGTSGTYNPLSQLEFVYATEKELGNLLVKIDQSIKAGIVVVEFNGKEIDRSPCTEGQNVVFKGLLPGEYQLLLINDENNNGLWDPIDLEGNISAEPVKMYRKIPKLRANWDVQVSLE